MKIKTDVEFISFGDGVCDIYTVDDEDTRTGIFAGLGFSNRVLGYNRVFAAAAVQVMANRVIRIPQVAGVDTGETVEIAGVGKYRVEMVQTMFETNPTSIDLTLRQIEMFTVTP